MLWLMLLRSFSMNGGSKLKVNQKLEDLNLQKRKRNEKQSLLDSNLLEMQQMLSYSKITNWKKELK